MNPVSMPPHRYAASIMQRAPSAISDEDFITAYNAASSLRAVIQSLGWSKAAVLAHVKTLRRRGVVLRTLPRTESKRQAEFIELWQAADSLEEVAERYGITVRGATKKAHVLRKKKGHVLKKFPTAISKPARPQSDP